MYMKADIYLYLSCFFATNERYPLLFVLTSSISWVRKALSSNLAEDNAGEANHACEAYGGHARVIGGCRAEAGNDKG